MHRLLLVVLAFVAAPAQAQSPTHVAPPASGTWVRDLTGKLQESTLVEANALAEAANREGVGQIAVAVVRSTRGADPRAYATLLFNSWGVGRAGRDDGILLFIALEDRAAEIILGNGVDSAASIAVTDRIMAEQVVANMKRGLLDVAVREATRALADHLRTRPTGRTSPQATSVTRAPPAESPAPSGGWLWPLALTALVAGSGWGGLRYLRRRPRSCGTCGRARVLLDEEADDAHLDPGQQAEEQLQSVDYDVWWCRPCNDALVLRRGRWFSRRTRCSKCGYKTAASSTLTLEAATEYSEGRVQVTETCAHCHEVWTYTHSTPRVLPSTSSDSSSSSGSGSSGGSSSGSGSSGSW
jgi:uncharacterized protein